MKLHWTFVRAGLLIALGSALMSPASAEDPCSKCWQQYSYCLTQLDRFICDARLRKCLSIYQCPG